MPLKNRRQFLQQSNLAIAGAGAILASSGFVNKGPIPDIPKNTIIVLQGDSITDGGRDKSIRDPNLRGAMGSGYALLLATELLGTYPELKLSIYNRGISGNKVFQLADRWSTDCMALRPTVLSILIGVNDFWHTLSHGYNGSAETYDYDLRNLLDRTKSGVPNVKLIVGEPFAVKGGTALSNRWYPAFEAYRSAAQKVASDYDAAWIPYQTIFDEALKKAPVSYWCPDGVHPSMAGSHLMKEAWKVALNQIYS